MRSFISATKLFIDGGDTPRAFLERCVELIHQKESEIGAFVALNLPAARRAADEATERWRKRKPLSEVDGMPIGVKDIMETADMPTEQGSPLFKAWRGGRDAAAVSALREAGAVIVGKTVTTEFAASEPRGTRNPHDSSRTPGGSSSGSAAAVAAGMLPAALGTQLFGSIIRPASFCGCFGFKPSLGAINRGGSFDGFSQSCTGVLASTLEDSWVFARNISERVGGDPGYPGLSGPLRVPAPTKPRRIAMLTTEGWDVASEEAKQALHDACSILREAGITILEKSTDKLVADVEAAIAQAVELTTGISNWEGRWPLNTYARDMTPSQLSEAAMERLSRADAMRLEQYQPLLKKRCECREIYARLQHHCDLCLTLSAPGPAPVGTWTGDPVFAAPASMLGAPALSLPVLEAESLPLGLQTIGFRDRDAALIGFSSAMLALLGIAEPHANTAKAQSS